jgi:DNA-directed RNA polymerase specialized sigma24 family protein
LVTWRKVGALAFRDAWVLRVTANVAIDWRRRRRASVDVDPTVEGMEEATVVRLALTAALAALPRRPREVVALPYLVG